MPVYLCGYRLPGGGDISPELGVERWGKEIERFPKTLLCLLYPMIVVSQNVQNEKNRIYFFVSIRLKGRNYSVNEGVR